MPKVSVIMPAYNAEKYIAQAIESILGQSYRDMEFIILNDCSMDRTEEIILSYQDSRIVYLKNERNMGVAATLNKGMAAAKGCYIARMDADDISLPQRLEKQVAFLDAHPAAAVVGTDLERFGEGIPSQIRRFSGDPAQMKVDLLFACGLAHPSVMMRREAVEALGGYDMEFEGLEDYELWCRMAAQGDVSVVPQVLFRYRVHPGQVTKNPSAKYLAKMERLKRRQLQQLGLEATEAEVDCFLNFCLGRRPRDPEGCLALSRLFERMLEANRSCGYYDEKRLSGVFRSILLGSALKLTGSQGRQLCRQSQLISPAELAKQRLKARVKRLLGRR